MSEEAREMPDNKQDTTTTATHSSQQNEKKDERISVAGPVWKLKTMPEVQLSPISEIAMTLGESSIATPTTTKPKMSRIGNVDDKMVMKAKTSIECETISPTKDCQCVRHLIVYRFQRILFQRLGEVPTRVLSNS